MWKFSWKITHRMWQRIYLETLFLKKQNRAYLWTSIRKYHTVCFYGMSKMRAVKILKLSSRPFPFNWYKAFLGKNKNISGTNQISFSGCLYFVRRSGASSTRSDFFRWCLNPLVKWCSFVCWLIFRRWHKVPKWSMYCDSVLVKRYN